MDAEIEQELGEIEQELAEREFYLLLGGTHDQSDAFLSIHAGTGGEDAEDCAALLMRMFLRYAERKQFSAAIIDNQPSDAGLKKATIELKGDYAYGFLRSEAGVHRIVRLSPFNANNLRQTSFVLVEVIPAMNDAASVAIKPDDLRIDTFRASGAGGQHVNKTSSAVRITHLPTGIVVSCQQERSQLQNRESAMKLLSAKLAQIEEEKRSEAQAAIKGEHKQGSWGNQIRSYVFHPYQMVKDHRTGAETSNIQDVMDGNLELFVEKFLEWDKQGGATR